MKENKSFADKYGFAICAIAIFGMFVIFPIGSTIYQNNKVICSEEDTPYRTDYERVEENTGDISLSGKSKEEKLQNTIILLHLCHSKLISLHEYVILRVISHIVQERKSIMCQEENIIIQQQ